jgi:hypothetical protein
MRVPLREIKKIINVGELEQESKKNKEVDAST